MSANNKDLPHSIIVNEILTKLPVKTLCRFKSVSKFWNEIISNTQFAKSHFKYNNRFICNRTSIFFQHDGNSYILNHEAFDVEDPTPFDLSDKDNINRGSLVSLGREIDTHLNGLDAVPFGSSCGLVCFSVHNSDSILICNPILNHFRTILAPRPFITQDIILRGFGHVSSIDDFKVVLGLRGRSKDEIPTIFIFSLRENGWRNIEGGQSFDIVVNTSRLDRDGILVVERLYWWASPISIGEDDGSLLVFDLVDEKFEEIGVPVELSHRVRFYFDFWGFTGMSANGWHLCFCVLTYDKICLWVLKERQGIYNWVKIPNLSFPLGDSYYFSKSFGITKSAKFLIWCSSSSKYHLFIGDPSPSQELKLTMIGNFGPTNACIVNYVESLVSPLRFQETTS